MRLGSSSWLAWPLVALAALPVVVNALVARRILSGQTQLFGDVQPAAPLRDRVGLLLTFTQVEAQLTLSLVALAGAWFVSGAGARRPQRGPLWAGAVVAAAAAVLALGHCLLVGYLAVADTPGVDRGPFGQEAVLELYGPRAAASVVLVVLAGIVVAVLVTAARRRVPHADELLVDEPPPASPEPAPEPSDVATPVPPAPAADPHARFRRPPG